MVAFFPGSGCTVALGDIMVAFVLGFGDITAVSPLDLGTLRLGTPWWLSSLILSALGDTMVAFLYGSEGTVTPFFLALGTSQQFPLWTWGHYSVWGHRGGLSLWV